MRTVVLIVICSLLVAAAAYRHLLSSSSTVISNRESPQLTRFFADLLLPRESVRSLDSLDLDDMLNDLASISADERARAIHQLAVVWAEEDPRSLFQHASRLPEELRSPVRAAVALEWARLDADAFLDYAEEAPSVDGLEPGLRLLLESDADRVFMVARRLTPEQDDAVTYRGVPFPALLMDAIDRLVDESATDAWELMRSLPEDRERSRLMRIMGATYAKKDPEAALRWLDEVSARAAELPAQTLETEILLVELDMIAAVSTVDLDLGMKAMQTRARDNSHFSRFVSATAYMFAEQDPDLVRASADRLVIQEEQENETEGLEILKRRFLVQWVDQDAETALDWVLENTGHVETDLAEMVVNRMAEADLESAVALLDRVPMEWRNLWIAEMAKVYAGQDAAAAIDWLSQFSGLPDYERLMEGVMPQIASTDPVTAARWIDSAGTPAQPETIHRVARAWAAADPASAAQWVAQFGDQQAHLPAISAITSAWVIEEPDATVQWVMTLPDADVRDLALRSVALRGSRQGHPDVLTLLPLFQSHEIGQDALRTVIIGNPDRVDELLGYVTDPEFRARVLETDPNERRPISIHTIP